MLVCHKHVCKMSLAEKGTLRWMCCKTRRQRIRNETVHEVGGVVLIEEKLRNRLRWFGNFYRRLVDAEKKVDRIVFSSNGTGRGRPKLTLDVFVL